jgi:hypothetical protein
MKALCKLTILICAGFSAAACSPTVKAIEPCDLLVPINPRPETNTYLVTHDRTAAVDIARHRGRYALYCGKPE